MNQVEERLDELVKALQDSREYKRYHEAREKLGAYPELEQAVHEFRRKNYEIQNSHDLDIFAETDALERESSKIRKNPIVEEYLSSELALCRMVQNINWKLVEGLDFEVGFMNERG